jgi:DtxR family Mn-dependent transcriptional regulator
VNYAPYEVVTLTDDGRAAAERVDRRHRRLVGFLAGVLGIEQGLAEAEACRLEHGLSRATADGLAGLVEFLEERPAVMAEWRKALGRRGRETGAGSDRPGTANTAGGNR